MNLKGDYREKARIDNSEKTIDLVAGVQGDIICHINDIAIRLEQKLEWDQKKELFVNNNTANRRLSRPMRSGWVL